jgi:predicted RNA-binding protein with PUA-like domain
MERISVAPLGGEIQMKNVLPRYWLMKTEPDVFSINDLKSKKRAPWDGVRNYQARNFMKEMKVGDWILLGSEMKQRIL